MKKWKGQGKGEGWVFPNPVNGARIDKLKTSWPNLMEAAKIDGFRLHDLRRTFSAVAGAVNVELWRTKALMGHKQKQDVTLHHYKELSDVRFLKTEADKIAGYYAEQRHIHEAGNVVRLERRA